MSDVFTTKLKPTTAGRLGWRLSQSGARVVDRGFAGWDTDLAAIGRPRQPKFYLPHQVNVKQNKNMAGCESAGVDG